MSEYPKVVDHEEDNWFSDRCLKKNWPYVGDCPVLITNAVPHSIGTVGVIGSGGAASTVAVFQDELQQGDNGEDDFADGDDEDEDADRIDHTKLPEDVVYPHTPTKRSHTTPV